MNKTTIVKIALWTSLAIGIFAAVQALSIRARNNAELIAAQKVSNLITEAKQSQEALDDKLENAKRAMAQSVGNLYVPLSQRTVQMPDVFFRDTPELNPTSALISWNTVPDADFYRVYYSTNQEESKLYRVCGEVSNGHTLRVNGLLPKTTYYFVIRSCMTNGVQSGLSEVLSYTTP